MKAHLTTRLVAALLVGACLLAPGHALAKKKRKRLPGRSSNITVFKNDTRLLVVNRESDTLAMLGVRNKGADIQQLIVEVGVGHEPRCVALGPKEREDLRGQRGQRHGLGGVALR
jgi:hypothetical protein